MTVVRWYPVANENTSKDAYEIIARVNNRDEAVKVVEDREKVKPLGYRPMNWTTDCFYSADGLYRVVELG